MCESIIITNKNNWSTDDLKDFGIFRDTDNNVRELIKKIVPILGGYTINEITEALEGVRQIACNFTTELPTT